MSFKDLMAKERALKEKAGSESSNLSVKPDSSSTSAASESDSKKK